MDALFENPPLVLAITLAVALLIQYQRTLSWPEYRLIHQLKIRYAPLVDRNTALFVLSRKGYRDDPEFIGTYDKCVKETWKRLVASGGQPHLINSIKVRRTPEGEKQFSQAHVVWKHADSDGDGYAEQTEAYLFDNGDGTTDAYAHFEGHVTGIEDHLHGGQTDGDPNGVVFDALA